MSNLSFASSTRLSLKSKRIAKEGAKFHIGMIKIVSGKDKRIHFVKITPKGKTVLQKTLPYWGK